MSRHVCVRDVNLAVTVLCVNTGNSHSTSPWRVVGVIDTVIFTHFFDSESGKNSNCEGSKQEEIDTLRLRDHFDFVFGSELDFAG